MSTVNLNWLRPLDETDRRSGRPGSCNSFLDFEFCIEKFSETVLCSTFPLYLRFLERSGEVQACGDDGLPLELTALRVLDAGPVARYEHNELNKINMSRGQ